MQNLEKIIDTVKHNEKDIVDNINIESIAVYKFLHEEFEKGDVTSNPLFQFVFRSFYRIDNAGLTDGFKTEYFSIMQNERLDLPDNPDEVTVPPVQRVV